MAAPVASLELALDPGDAARLPRLPPFAGLRAGRARKTAAEFVWYDTPAGALAEAGLSLCERRVGRETVWRLERIRGTPTEPWPPGTPPPVVAEAAGPAALPGLPAPLLPVAAFAGALHAFPTAEGESLALVLLSGTLRAVAGARPVCRVLLAGEPAALEPLALALADAASLHVPAAALAAEAYAVAGRVVPPRALGSPELPADIAVGDAFAAIAGHLVAVLLHWAPLAPPGEAPEPVHQMRVALRRLRSAMALFRRAVGGPALDAAKAELRGLADRLGPARDWDVFTTGIGQEVGASFPDDRAVARLLAAAEKQRRAAYAELRDYLGSPAFRALILRLACLAAFRPWRQAAPADPDEAAKQAAVGATPLAEFAAHALGRRLDRVLEPGEDIAGLPAEALHRIRIRAKRLRYAAEFFAPLFPRKETRRFHRRIGALQERLGHVNDGRTADDLLAQLGGGGTERARAVGTVRGFVAAGLGGARAKSVRSWHKLRRLEPFWHE